MSTSSKLVNPPGMSRSVALIRIWLGTSVHEEILVRSKHFYDFEHALQLFSEIKLTTLYRGNHQD